MCHVRMETFKGRATLTGGWGLANGQSEDRRAKSYVRADINRACHRSNSTALLSAAHAEACKICFALHFPEITVWSAFMSLLFAWLLTQFLYVFQTNMMDVIFTHSSSLLLRNQAGSLEGSSSCPLRTLSGTQPIPAQTSHQGTTSLTLSKLESARYPVNVLFCTRLSICLFNEKAN